MAGVLGIDAAWTGKEPSGVALLTDSPQGWRCVAVAPSYNSFLSLAEGQSVDWSIKSKGAVPNAGRLLAAAERLLKGQQATAVTVDIPLSTVPITGRREADTAISTAFGGKGAAVHSPSVERPGIISTRLHDGFIEAGLPLATTTTPAGTKARLLEGTLHSNFLRRRDCTNRLATFHTWLLSK